MEIGLVSLASQGHTRCTHRTYIYTHGHIYTLHKQRDAFIAFHVKPQGLKTSAIVFCGRCPSYTPFPICLLTLVVLQPCPTCSMVQTKIIFRMWPRYELPFFHPFSTCLAAWEALQTLLLRCWCSLWVFYPTSSPVSTALGCFYFGRGHSAKLQTN